MMIARKKEALPALYDAVFEPSNEGRMGACVMNVPRRVSAGTLQAEMTNLPGSVLLRRAAWPKNIVNSAAKEKKKCHPEPKQKRYSHTNTLNYTIWEMYSEIMVGWRDNMIKSRQIGKMLSSLKFLLESLPASPC